MRAGNREAIVVTASSATDGFRALAGGGADMVMSARPMLQGERDALTAVGTTTPASEHVIALGGLAVVVNQASPLTALRMEQVRGVFGGALRDWNAIGGGSGPIHVYIQQSPSELRDKFAQLAQSGGNLASDATAEADAAQVEAAVAADPYGIGVVDLPHATDVRALALGGASGTPVAPTNTLAVALGDYPLGYRLYFYNPGLAADPILQHFVAFALSPDGQALLPPIGLISPFLMPPSAPLPSAAPADLRKFVATARRLPVAFHFKADGSELDEDSARDVDRLAFLLQSNHVAADRLLLAGFSDNHQRPSVSLAGARARADGLAMAFARYGLPPARVEGFGMEFPVAENSTEEGRARNRRVEVYLLP
jgi:phosphate transport system substrate-binding protein